MNELKEKLDRVKAPEYLKQRAKKAVGQQPRRGHWWPAAAAAVLCVCLIGLFAAMWGVGRETIEDGALQLQSSDSGQMVNIVQEEWTMEEYIRHLGHSLPQLPGERLSGRAVALYRAEKLAAVDYNASYSYAGGEVRLHIGEQNDILGERRTIAGTQVNLEDRGESGRVSFDWQGQGVCLEWKGMDWQRFQPFLEEFLK